MKNKLVVEIFRDVAEILEIKGENVFRIRAYLRAADTVEGLAEDLETIAAQGRLTDIPGIGKDLSAKIEEIITTGKLAFLEELKKTIPDGLLELLNIPSVGPKTAKLLSDTLQIKSVSDLKKAIEAGKLANIPGIKEKTVENIAKGIALLERGKERMPLGQAIAQAENFQRALQGLKEVQSLSVAGSLRRRRETIRDIDILVVSEQPQKVMDTFTRLEPVKDILAHGPTKASIRTKDDIQVDCRVVEAGSFGAALLYFTGSKNFNIRMRMLAQKKGWKINEYGVFKGARSLAGKSEEEIFKLFKLDYIPPELREDTGEIDLARKHALPQLVELADIKGDLHVHSKWSDGQNTIAEMAKAAQAKGYAYIAVTDHSQSLKVANGLSISDLAEKKAEIERVNKSLKGLRVLFGTEVDIDSNGDIDYPDDVLKGFDLVVAAVHTGFKQSKEQITRRMVKACRNKHVHMISHPTGRLWGTRDAYEVDMEEVMKAAADTNTILEVNAFPQRLDLNDMHCRLAREKGVKVAVNTDAHVTAHLENMYLGLYVARRGWMEAQDVVNTRTLPQLLKLLKR
jgi:DNA polymerase (family 10)